MLQIKLMLRVSVLATMLTPSFIVAVTNTESLHIGDRTCLFLDDRYIAGQHGLERVWHQGRPQPVIIERTEPWEDPGKPGGLHLYGSVVFDAQDHTYKMYYQTYCSSMPGGYGSCLALSKDGKLWTKPNLGLVEIGENKNNNVFL